MTSVEGHGHAVHVGRTSSAAFPRDFAEIEETVASVFLGNDRLVPKLGKFK